MADLPVLTPGQARQARALLAWSQRELATQASLAVSTVADFERGYRSPVPNNLEAMRAALERAGVAFLADGATTKFNTDAVVAARSGGLPIRFIDATDLAGEWADRRYGAQEQMPTVISNLIRASVGLAARLNFPSAESIQHPGPDGSCEIEVGTEFIPTGLSIWEFGAQSDGITNKANKDYEKRSNEIPPLDRKTMTFVFVTPRRWRDKAKWVKARRGEQDWRDVVAYDADKLVHWLENYPAVGHWLATVMGKRPRGVMQLRHLWDEWSQATKPPMSSGLMLAGRQETEVDVWRWLSGPPGVLAMRADSVEEALAFAYAALEVLPVDKKAAFIARSLFVAEPDQARTLGDSLTPLFLFLKEPDPGLATSLAARGHHVYAAYGPGTVDSEAAIFLARPSRYEIQRQLEEMQLDRERAVQLSQDAGQSMTVLRRLMPSAPGWRVPDWAKSEHAPSLVVALLAGGWDESSEGDRSIIERLGSRKYSDIVADLTAQLAPSDSPLRKAGQIWKIASPRDAWLRLVPKYLTATHLKRFADVAVEVLSSHDPRYDLPNKERWLASMRGVQPAYSDTIMAGLTETLGLLAIFGTEARGVDNAELVAERVVSELLVNADERRWWSLSSRFEALAEACPRAFLDALENDLDRNEPSVMVLFKEDEGGLAGRNYLTHLLWALEILARCPCYLAPAARLLARLADADPNPNSRQANRPARSLGQIFSLIFPQTNASLADRLQVLNVLRKEQPKVVWKLMLDMLPKGRAVGEYGPLPRWRDFSEPKAEEPTWPLIWKAAETITGWLLEHADTSPHRWAQLVEVSVHFPPARRTDMIGRLRNVAPKLIRDEDREPIWAALRHMINHHRRFAGSDWALPESDLAEIESVYHLFEPGDPVARVSWMFWGPEPELLRPSAYERDTVHTGWVADRIEAETLRRLAIDDLFGQFGPDVLLRLAQSEKAVPRLIGAAFAHSNLDENRKEHLLVKLLRANDHVEFELAAGILLKFNEKKGVLWSQALLKRAITEKWDAEAVVRLLIMLPGERQLWDQISDFGSVVEALYWRRMPALLAAGNSSEDLEFLAIKLLSNNRAYDALRLLVYGKDKVRGTLLADALEAAAKDAAGHQDNMIQYYVEESLGRLDLADEISKERIALIEWRYLPVLAHSRRTTWTLHKLMAQRSDLFVMVLRALYKPEPGSGFVEVLSSNEGNVEAMATRAFDLLRSWHVVPGVSGSTVDAAELEGWIEKTRRLCQEIGRTISCDHCIGQMLAHAPAAADGTWPAIAVREVIKITRSHDLDRGVEQGLFNKRGATWRDPSTGGNPERGLAAQYRSWAQSMELEWPRTSAILAQVARSYEGIGRSWDDDAKRRNW